MATTPAYAEGHCTAVTLLHAPQFFLGSNLAAASSKRCHYKKESNNLVSNVLSNLVLSSIYFKKNCNCNCNNNHIFNIHRFKDLKFKDAIFYKSHRHIHFSSG